jgi:hypothetical protein
MNRSTDDPGQIPRRGRGAVLGAAALGCRVCLLPALLAGGALGSAVGALGGGGIALALVAAALGLAAGSVILLRRSRRPAGCGCAPGCRC